MSLLDPVLGWTLQMPPILGILCLALLITLIINLIYKFTTNQAEMKRMKEQIQDFQKQMKEAQKQGNQKRMLKLNQEAMSVNMQYMGKSLKPTLYTFLPIIFIFAWMNSHFTYAPLAPGQPLTVNTFFVDGFTGTASLTSPSLTPANSSADITVVDKNTVAKFAVSGESGPHPFNITYEQFTYNGTVWFGQNPPQQLFPGNGPVKQVQVEYPRIHPLGDFHLLSWYPGWLSVYITLSIILSMSTRKLMKIY